MDNSTPGGLEIAHVMLERIDALGWSKAWWSSCDGMAICPRWTQDVNGLIREAPGTYVFLSGFQDLDYERAFLLTVCTQTDDETWVDYLSVFQKHAGLDHLDVEWAQRPHRFSEPANHRGKALHWWVDLVEAVR
jgi:hypothetical protein